MNSFYQKIRVLQRTQTNLDSFIKKVDQRLLTDEPPTGQSPMMCRNDDSSPSTLMWLFMIFIRESLVMVFNKERLFMRFKFTCTVYKS